ncbi:DUF6397 family protein [Streptomyces pilosus]|uniref:DUF6397 family protein n=1 Tax=Streptomyces pilosus TaxID=28893 RepID=UPI003635FD2E
MPGQHTRTPEATGAEPDGAPADAGGGRHRTAPAPGAAEGAALMGVSKIRFTRLARLGLLVPVAFRSDRYRAVAWLYPARELTLFASDDGNAPLLTGRLSESLRGQLDTGLDLRPRNWRARHLGLLLRRADGPWARAGAVASLLPPAHVAQLVTDSRDRSRLTEHLVPPPSHGTPGSPASRIAENLMTVRDPDEIARLRSELARLIHEAREAGPVGPRTSRPGPRLRGPGPDHRMAPGTAGPPRRPLRGGRPARRCRANR